jgi:MFS transporter, SP family, general alpha glucoside:H+ symporter
MTAWIADKLGRRPALGFIFTIRLVSITLEYISTTNSVFFGGRFLGGFATVCYLLPVCQVPNLY